MWGNVLFLFVFLFFCLGFLVFFFFFQAEDGIRDYKVTGVQTCALPIWAARLPNSVYPYSLTSWRNRSFASRALPSAMLTSASVNSASGITRVRGYSLMTNSSRGRAAAVLPWLK